MKRKCKNCEKEFEGTARANFCSSKCRLSFHRNNRSVSKSDETVKNETVNETETDALFQQDAIDRGLGEDWLSFSEIVRQPDCRSCGDTFKTRLGLLNYCSPDCREEAYHV